MRKKTGATKLKNDTYLDITIIFIFLMLAISTQVTTYLYIMIIVLFAKNIIMYRPSKKRLGKYILDLCFGIIIIYLLDRFL